MLAYEQSTQISIHFVSPLFQLFSRAKTLHIVIALFFVYTFFGDKHSSLLVKE